MKRLLLLLLAATALWLPNLHRFHRTDDDGREAIGARLASDRSTLTSSDRNVLRMRSVNPEWDFMQRTYEVLGLANRALSRVDERTRDLAAIDRRIASTLATATASGDEHFMLAYAKRGPFQGEGARSLFIDGEIVAMIAARELVEPHPAWHELARQRAERITGTMTASPTRSGESYPDECWTFCNTTALAGLVMLDAVDGTNAHGPLVHEWLTFARERLVDAETGLLVSSYTYRGQVLDGPEGSSLWMTTSNLLLLDEELARDQYRRARRELGVSFLGFGWAREWPSHVTPAPDVDSGPIVPLLGASAGSSGLAILGASAFGDHAFRDELLSSLSLVGFQDEGSGRYRASNEVGDAVLLYALAFGPLWERAKAPPPTLARRTGGVR